MMGHLEKEMTWENSQHPREVGAISLAVARCLHLLRCLTECCGDLSLELWRPEGQGGGASAEGLAAASVLGGRHHMLRDSQRGPSLVLRQVPSYDDVDPLVAAQPGDLMAPSRPHLSTLLRWR